jgi:perosamine synthetase
VISAVSSHSESAIDTLSDASIVLAFEPVGPGHVEVLANLFARNALPAVTEGFDPFPLTLAQAQQIALAPRKDAYYVAFSDGQAVGFSMLRGFDEGYEVPSFGIFVDHEHHALGIGRRLTEWTIEQARLRRCPAMRLSVYSTNLVAHRLYRLLGFSEQDREPIERDGRMEEKVVMKLDLTDKNNGRRRIPVAAPALVGREREYVLDCLDSTWISSSGRYLERFEAAFAEFCGVRYAIACCNGTVAVHLALLAHEVGPGDEVIVPTLTYVATANPVVYCGARPVFVDSEPHTWNMDPDRVAAAITPRTRGIVVVHLYGHPVDMDPILELAKRHKLWVIEDAAEAHGARYQGRIAGSMGSLSTFSFYGNKIITSGEGGMVITDDERLASLVRQLHGQGQDPQRRYWFPMVGFNYRMTNIEAAIGLAQLERIDWHLGRRREIAGWYREELADEDGIELSPQAPWAESSFWIMCAVLDESRFGQRDDVMASLEEDGIETRPFFYPLHTLPMYQPLNEGRRFPVAEDLARRGINLPSSAMLTRQDVAYVCERLRGLKR